MLATPYTTTARRRDLYKFYRRYGMAMSSWADIEHVLSKWFVYACGGDKGDAHRMSRIFYSARSFNGSADMLRAAFAAGGMDEDLTSFFTEAMNRTGGYYQFRNKMAHHITVYREIQHHVVLAKGADPHQYDEEITERHLVIATRNFVRLRNIWLHVLPSLWPKPLLTPAEGIQRVEELPGEAHSNELSQKQKGRQRQRLLRKS